MKGNKLNGLILLCCGIMIIAAGLFIYFLAHQVYPVSDSPRVQDLNTLLNLFGKTGTALLVSVMGLVFVILGFRKLKTIFFVSFFLDKKRKEKNQGQQEWLRPFVRPAHGTILSISLPSKKLNRSSIFH